MIPDPAETVPQRLCRKDCAAETVELETDNVRDRLPPVAAVALRKSPER